jgi:hypothetical protein
MTNHLPLALHSARLPFVNRLADPRALAIFSFIFFIACWCIPPSIYTYYTREPNLLFLDGATLLLFSACTFFFVLGDKLASGPNQMAPRMSPQFGGRLPSAMFLALPLVAGIAATCLSSFIIVANNPEVLILMFAGELGQEKNNLELAGSFSLSASALTGILWWASYRFGQVELTGLGRRTIRILLVASLITVLVSSSLKLARGELMPVVAGLAIIHLDRRTRCGHVDVLRLLRGVVLAAIGISGLFLLFSFLRGITDSERLLRDMLGYTVTSYNRLAAIVSGNLRYPFAGKGLYLSSFLSFNATLNDVVPLARIFDWPSFIEVWGSEFAATWKAGLNGFLIWSGAFGYIFADLGWYAPSLLFLYGFVYRMVWTAYCRGATWAVVLYPWFAFCVLFWFGTNFLLDTKAVVLLLTGFGLTCYERLALTVIAPSRPSPAFP